MKKTGVFLLLLLLFVPAGPASAYEVVTDSLKQAGNGQIQYATTASIEIKHLDKAKRILGLQAKGGHTYTSGRYCTEMIFTLKGSGGHCFLTAECPCYACYEKIRYDFGRLGKAQVALNGRIQSDKSLVGLLDAYGFTIKYASSGNVACVSGSLDSTKIAAVEGGIKGTIAKNQDSILVGVPVIDVLY